MGDPYTLGLSAKRHFPGDHSVFAWSVCVRLPWFRALPVSCVEQVLLTLDGEVIPETDLLAQFGGRLVPLSALRTMPDRYWAVEETLSVGVPAGGPVPPAGTVVSVELTLRMPDGGGPDWVRRTSRASVRLPEPREARWPLGVCTFSFGGELRRGRSLRSCLQEVARAGYAAVELLGAQVVEGYPAPEPRWLDRFSGMVRETGLVPLCYDAFLDPGRSTDGTVDDTDLLRWADNELTIAEALGCRYVRLNAPPRLLERLAGSADRRDLVVLTELHAQTAHDTDVQTLLELLHGLHSSRLGLILDLSCVMRSLPAGFTARLPGDIARTIENGWHAGTPLPVLQAELAGTGAGDEAARVAQRAYRLFRRSGTGWLPDVLPFTRIVHGKFYEMHGGQEPAISYRDVLAELSKAQFDGYLMSEFEGHLWQEAPDTFGQLAEHRRMISELSDA
ncbi:hypothetical protein FHX82_005455 [Amycolatopsis bartoniae]|uniref:C-deglycosylation enzyme beta subunit n=1 Tax=Amycolatopsis bartoniae TaxID=941986 RepID=A0A8H9IN65_9PSEU|nr:DUF6379 domain-containing protein [Amycolatopsis bartoniae]MBB2938379.1 hypothetical protein [Amycolatopsis bartoniae]GHF34758.1 hypothetical protein GCM10017566_04330 [Amycolatopsis bartoniae]